MLALKKTLFMSRSHFIDSNGSPQLAQWHIHIEACNDITFKNDDGRRSNSHTVLMKIISNEAGFASSWSTYARGSIRS